MKPPSGRRRRAAARRPARPEVRTLTAFLVVASVVAAFLVLTRPDHTAPAASANKTPRTSTARTSTEPAWNGKTEILGDGSTSYTGPKKGELKPKPLKPGEKPPQFVVFSWDGALEGSDQLFSHYRELAKKYDAHMTFFLTGIYLLPKSRAKLYHPPRHPVGTAAIDYATGDHIRTTLEQLRLAYEDGNEIGSHFNGHFCGKKGGGDWSVAEWKSEIDQFYAFVENWKTNTGYTDVPALPFDFRKEVTGGRAPCLEGQKNLLKAVRSYGWRYDASSTGDFQIWPARKNGVWNFPLQLLPYEQGKYQGLSMDFNFLANQSKGEIDGNPADYTRWQRQTVDSYLAGFDRVYYGSRAPLFIGNHFEGWNGGIYMKAVDQVVKNVCTKKGVKCVSFKELADWLDVQQPETLARLRGLDPAQAPDWSTIAH
ncbi:MULTISPECIES: hypothetical protein [unclassified Streptomyces]|uniref:hypothetical protein n=1 Tax=unclassified Streptomyces TaxID=2593676 RepID=UPI002253CA88|nr:MULTISPECIES: hypothetical protein [unclassified Streptomyces]MCX5057435.1 hypothetical protein [Streptomyces sp. NBC_00452]MCX5288509.1 hypothetical protein [Streptomyces sp. NBC_00183]